MTLSVKRIYALCYLTNTHDYFYIEYTTITMTSNLAIDVVARLAIINPIAVANVEAGLGAVPPDCMLDEPRKRLREIWIELPGIDPVPPRSDRMSGPLPVEKLR
jgi:hypothetical protein